MFEDKNRKLAKELKKVQELNHQSEEELQKYEVRFQEVQSDLLGCQDRNRLGLAEITAKEEELVVHKVELSSLQEKYRTQCEEVKAMSYFNITYEMCKRSDEC